MDSHILNFFAISFLVMAIANVISMLVSFAHVLADGYGIAPIFWIASAVLLFLLGFAMWGQLF